MLLMLVIAVTASSASAKIIFFESFESPVVTGYANNTVLYMAIGKAISPRHVDFNEVALYEQLGFCFGRVRNEYNPAYKKENRTVERIY